ncbi:MAG: outer membrane transport family protein [Alphaproteobacteria bacterium]|nr:outer membrane transport family protein [Alphaproteobacteria bacterium]
MFKKALTTTALCAITAASALIISADKADAAGFYIQEQSVSALGAAFSGSTTSIDDASTIYFNPAGMTRLDGPQGNLGVNLLIPEGELTDTGTTTPIGTAVGDDGGNPYDPTPVPNAYIAYPWMNGKLWTGLGVSAPFGLANEYDDGYFGRYDSTETELLTVDVAPTVAFQAMPWLSLGGGVNIQYADAELKNAAFAGTEGEATLKGDDISVGYNLGVLVTPMQGTDIGFSYRSAISHELDGDIMAEGTGLLDFDTTGSADLDLPDIWTLGVAQDVNDKWRIMGQVTRFGWSNFQEIAPVRDDGVAVDPVVQNYQNTWAFAIGAEYEYSPEWTFRAGYQFDETPTTDEFRTTRTPDGDRNWFTAGTTYTWNENFTVDFAAAYIDVGEEEISVVRNGGGVTGSNVNADTDGQVGILSLGLNYKF